MLNANFTSCHKDVYYSGIKLFSALPSKIKTSNNDIKLLRPAFKDFMSLLILYKVKLKLSLCMA